MTINNSRTAFKPSRYNHFGKLSDGQMLVYNLFSNAVAIISVDEFGELQKDTITLKNSAEFFNTAIAMGFIVPEKEDEISKVLALRNINNFDNRRAGFQILPTTDCNAHCFYCYEKEYKVQTMSEDVIHATEDFIIKYLNGRDEINITWFGGEPFICESIIAEISSKIIKECKEKNVRYKASAITNGALITSNNLLKIARDYQIKDIQITLDGRGDEHIRRKAFDDRNLTYESILERIALLTKNDIKVMVRINIDKNNIDNCLGIIEDLAKLDSNKERLWPYAAPLYSNNNDPNCFGRDELCIVFEKFFKKLIDYGFIQTVDGLPMHYTNTLCCAKTLNNFVISPKGDLLKCEHLLDSSEEVIGDVFSGMCFNKAMAKWCEPDIPNKCKVCDHLPICQAGCMAAEERGFGYGRCSDVFYIDEAIIKSVDYLLQRRMEV